MEGGRSSNVVEDTLISKLTQKLTYAKETIFLQERHLEQVWQLTYQKNEELQAQQKLIDDQNARLLMSESKRETQLKLRLAQMTDAFAKEVECRKAAENRSHILREALKSVNVALSEVASEMDYDNSLNSPAISSDDEDDEGIQVVQILLLPQQPTEPPSLNLAANRQQLDAVIDTKTLSNSGARTKSAIPNKIIPSETCWYVVNSPSVENKPFPTPKLKIRLRQGNPDKNRKLHTFWTKQRSFFICICGKKFANQENLKKHINYHRNGRKFSCTKCLKCFSQRSSFNRHLLTVHKKSVQKSRITCRSKRFQGKSKNSKNGKKI